MNAGARYPKGLRMDLGLGGQVAVVVGGAQGLGLAIAKEFAAEGAAVALIDRDERVVAAAGALGSARGMATAGLGLVADVTDLPAVGAAAAAIEAQLGRVAHVVFAAAI